MCTTQQLCCDKSKHIVLQTNLQFCKGTETPKNAEGEIISRNGTGIHLSLVLALPIWHKCKQLDL